MSAFPRLKLLRVKLEAGRHLRRANIKEADINDLLSTIDDDLINHAAEVAGADVVSKYAKFRSDAQQTVGAIGDGTLINLFINFLKSDAGQALIAALVKILIGSL